MNKYLKFFILLLWLESAIAVPSAPRPNGTSIDHDFNKIIIKREASNSGIIWYITVLIWNLGFWVDEVDISSSTNTDENAKEESSLENDKCMKNQNNIEEARDNNGSTEEVEPPPSPADNGSSEEVEDPPADNGSSEEINNKQNDRSEDAKAVLAVPRLNEQNKVNANVDNCAIKTEQEKKKEPIVGCRDHLGNLVDWYLNFKLPKGVLEYMSFSSTDKLGDKFSIHDNFLGEKSHIGQTFGQFKTGPPDEHTLSLMYSDQLPDGETSFIGGQGAHAKGVIKCNSSGGFVILDSLPKWPTSENIITVGGFSLANAQHFFCFSINKMNLEDLAKILFIINAKFYQIHIPTNFIKRGGWLEKISEYKHAEYIYDDHELFDFNGLKMHVFYNSEKYKIEQLWELISYQYPFVDIITNTWLKGPNKGYVYSNEFPFYTVIQTQIVDTNLSWTHGHDHSKIGISLYKNPPLVCIGDVNFVSTQEKRSGSIWCMKNEKLWTGFQKTFKYNYLEDASAIRGGSKTYDYKKRMANREAAKNKYPTSGPDSIQG